MAIIAYVGPFVTASSSASAIRVRGVTEALATAGHTVHVCGITSASVHPPPGRLAPRVHLHAVDEYEHGLFSRTHRGLRGLFLGDATLRWLRSQMPRPDVVILYGTHSGYLTRLLRFCRANSIALLLDVVEWYDPSHLPGGSMGPFAAANEISMRILAPKADGILAISRYLEDYFAGRRCRTLRVPPLFPAKERPTQFRHSDERLHLCYVGSPGRKDDITSLLEGVQLAHDQGVPLVMHIVGPSREQCLDDYRVGHLSILHGGDVVRFHGWLHNDRARAVTASCDFLVLLRPIARFSKAGFPSKAAEGFRAGTPLMANLSSNLDEYLDELRNGLIVERPTPSSLCDALVRAARLGESDLQAMKEAAGETGRLSFSPESRQQELNAFIEDVRRRLRP